MSAIITRTINLGDSPDWYLCTTLEKALAGEISPRKLTVQVNAENGTYRVVTDDLGKAQSELPEGPNDELRVYFNCDEIEVRLYSNRQPSVPYIQISAPTRSLVDELSYLVELTCSKYLHNADGTPIVGKRVELSSVKVENVILHPIEFEKLGNLLEEAINQLDRRAHLEVQAVTGTGATVTGTPKILAPGGRLAKEKLTRISFSYWDLYVPIRLSLCISENSSYGDNRLDIEGTDLTWVLGAAERFRKFLSEVEKQREFTRFLRISIVAIVSLAVYAAWACLVFLVAHGFPSTTSANSKTLISGLVFLDLAGIVFSGPFLGTWVLRKIIMLYPSVELRSESSHLNQSYHRRQKLTWLASTVVIPILIALVFFLFSFT